MLCFVADTNKFILSLKQSLKTVYKENIHHFILTPRIFVFKYMSNYLDVSFFLHRVLTHILPQIIISVLCLVIYISFSKIHFNFFAKLFETSEDIFLNIDVLKYIVLNHPLEGVGR